MRVAFGFKAHSGWASYVVVGEGRGSFHVIDRRRIELIYEGEIWAKQPYQRSRRFGDKRGPWRRRARYSIRAQRRSSRDARSRFARLKIGG